MVKGAPIELTDDVSTEGYAMVIDVRSPSEYAIDHVPGAVNLPVLNDEERARVGTIYVQDNPFRARKIGAALVSKNIARMLEGPLAAPGPDFHPLIYCWRGGQRSGALATVLSQIGWRCTLLRGGYKTFRRRVVADLKVLPGAFSFICLSGLTGTGKTRILRRMAGKGFQVLDLERLAAHRGSLLGAAPEDVQPSQKGFETRLWQALTGFDPARPVWVESESSKVGDVALPADLWAALKRARVVAVSAPLEARVALLMDEYRYLIENADWFRCRITGLVELHGKKKVSAWMDLIEAGAWDVLVRDLLECHYDPAYHRSLARRRTRCAPLAEDEFSLPVLSERDIDALIARLERRYGC